MPPKKSKAEVFLGSDTSAIDLIIGSRVRTRRMEIGMSQETLGESVGLTFQQVQKYEKATNRIGCGRLVQFAHILKIDVHSFFDGVKIGRTNGRELIKSPVAEFMATLDGTKIINAMIRLSPLQRRAVIRLARSLAPDEDDED